MAKARAAKRKKAIGEALRRCSGTMTEAQYLAWIRSALRSKWLRWIPRSHALDAAKVPYVGDNPRRKYSYRCAICGGLFAQKEVEVDHFPLDAGSIKSVDDIGEFCNNLFCEVDNLRVVCVACHSVHTLSHQLGISFEEAQVHKAVNEFLKKESKQKVLDTILTSGYTQAHCRNADTRKEALLELFKRKQGVEIEYV